MADENSMRPLREFARPACSPIEKLYLVESSDEVSLITGLRTPVRYKSPSE